MSNCSIHFLSKISAHRCSGYIWLDNFMLSRADQAGSLDQALPKRGESVK
jgi:hypothetical protein